MVPERGRIWRVINLRQAATLADLYTAHSPAFYLSFSYFLSFFESERDWYSTLPRGGVPKPKPFAQENLDASQNSHSNKRSDESNTCKFTCMTQTCTALPCTHLCDTHKSWSEAHICTFYNLSECMSIHIHIYICRQLCRYTYIQKHSGTTYICVHKSNMHSLI